MSVATDVELCNHALSYLGDDRIASLEESNERARICNLLYEQTRDEIIATYQWPFAITRKSLAAASVDNYTPYEYGYQLPSNYIKLLDVLDDDFVIINGADYVMEGDKIWTDYSPLYIRYCQQITDPTKFPDLFVTTFEITLAAKIAPRLSQNHALAAQLAQYAAAADLKAKGELNKDAYPSPRRNPYITETN